MKIHGIDFTSRPTRRKPIWAWTQRDARFGMPENADTLEGWIADPALQ